MTPDHSRPRVIVASAAGTWNGIESALAALGYDVQLSSGVNETAGLLAEQSATAAVFTGVALHDGNWRDLVEQVKRRNPAAPIVLCAADVTAELWWDALESGILDIASPPYTSSQLEQILARR